MGNVIYLDHASTTPTDPEVVETMRPWFSEQFGNPSTVYSLGLSAARAVQDARESIADRIGADPEEIYFTSGGTEADNWAIQGAADANQKKGRHLVTSTIEHHAVLETMRFLEKRGWEITRLPVDGGGLVDPDDVRRAIRPDTVLVSIMHANNEVGTIQPIAEIGRIARQRGVTFHTDAVQAGGVLDLDVERLHVDLLSLSGHKLYAPKGVGVLYVRQGTPILPTQTGGGQEFGLRSGTENVPYAVGMAHALRLAHDVRASEGERLRSLRDRLIRGVLEAVPDARLTGHPTERLPGNASFCFGGLEVSRVSRWFLCWIWKVSAYLPDRPAQPALWTPATCSWPSASRPSTHTGRYGSLLGEALPRKTSISSSRSFRPSSTGFDRCRRSGAVTVSAGKGTDMYSELVMEHFRNPRNMGVIEDADGVGEVGNPQCGDMMRITIKVKDDVLEDIKFQTLGCGAAVATSSMVTEMAKGKKLGEAMEITNKAVAEALGGLPPAKMHCSNLAADGLQAAIQDYRTRHAAD